MNRFIYPSFKKPPFKLNLYFGLRLRNIRSNEIVKLENIGIPSHIKSDYLGWTYHSETCGNSGWMAIQVIEDWYEPI